MEKIWSSCIYYYGINKNLKNTYRISVCFLSGIDAVAMRSALGTAQRRYPYFSVKRLKTFKEIQLHKNDLPWVLREGENPITLGDEESNFHMIAFSYSKDILYIDVFHGLTDGKGIMNLLRTVIYYYCRQVYGENADPGDIRLVGQPIPDEEFDDPYLKLPQQANDADKSKVDKAVKKYMSLSEENKYKRTKPLVFHLLIPQVELMKYCGKNDGSPATAVALFMARAIKKTHANSEKLIGCGIATDLRKALGTTCSHHSTVAIPVLEFPDKTAKKSFEMQGTAFRGQVLLKCDADMLKNELYESNKFYKFINGLPMRKLKEAIMGVLVKAALGGPTAVISYTGKCDFGECEKYIKYMFLEPDAPGTGIMIEINAVNEMFCLTFIQEWQERTYFDAFCKELDECNITHTLLSEGEIQFPDIIKI